MLAVRPSQMFELAVRPPRVSWEDVAGCENARRELEEAIRYSTHLWYKKKVPHIIILLVSLRVRRWRFDAGRSPLLASLDWQAGILLYGPSGCGKTLCAHAFASVLRLPFIAIKGYPLWSVIWIDFPSHFCSDQSFFPNILVKQKA